MKYLAVVLFFSSIVFSGLSQNRDNVDSLKNALEQAKEDTIKVMLYEKLSREFVFSNPDSAIYFSSRGLKLARQIHFVNGEFQNLTFMGTSFAVKGNYIKAVETQLQAKALAEQMNDPKAIRTNLGHLGAAYQYSGDKRKALTYFNKTEATTLLNDQTKNLMGMIGQSYYDLKIMDSAHYYIKRVYDYDVQSDSHWSQIYYYMASINRDKGNLPQALEMYRQGVRYAEHKSDAIDGYNHIAFVSMKIGMKDSAIYYSKKAITEGAAFTDLILDASKLLVELYTSQHAFDSAFKYQQLELAAGDSLYSREKVMQLENISFNELRRQEDLLQSEERFKNTMRQYALFGGIAVLLLLMAILYRNNLQQQRAKVEIEKAYDALKSTQAQLIQSEKMASLGILVGGIAHEIQNPLNFVNNFSEVNEELLDDLSNEQQKASRDYDHEREILHNIIKNEQKIKHHGKRADAIVKDMLQHSRTNAGQKEQIDINNLADEYLKISYHGMRAKDRAFSASLKTNYDPGIEKISIIPQDIGRALLNLYNNAFYAVAEKQKSQPSGYEPTVLVSTSKAFSSGQAIIELTVRDNGNGMSQDVINKIFQPFYTTKPTGQGTGLGLSLTYDIVKAHQGELRVESKEGEGASFVIRLPG